MLVANDGLSAGHVSRAVALGRALVQRGGARDVAVRPLLVTTSEADTLLAGEPLALVRLPAPLAARRAGFSDTERRRLVRACLEAALSAFAPDVLVADTFPEGPHGELAGAREARARRVLVRRHIPPERLADDALAVGLERYELAILAGDPVALEANLPMRCVHVAPITRADASALAPRAEARARLGLPALGRIVLVTSGGGGDASAAARAARLAEVLVDLDPSLLVAVTCGPLEAAPPSLPPRVVALRVAPLAPWLLAFDGAFSAAGYNTAHELALAGVPAALFASPRPFDDQRARARRFAAAGLAFSLEHDDAGAIRAALTWIDQAERPSLTTGGAAQAADAVLDLATRTGS